MTRGTTPTYTITIPPSLNTNGITKLYLVFRQQATVVSKPIDMSDIDKLKVTLTQNETLKFKVGEVLLQLVGKIGEETVFATTVGKDKVSPILLEGVI